MLSKLIGITGGSKSGKTTLTKQIAKGLENRIQVISLDNYYKPHWNKSLKERYNINFDSPDSFDWRLLYEHVELLKKGKSVEIPVYNFKTHSRIKNETIPANPKEIIIIEGIHALNKKRLRDQYCFTVYIHLDDHLRLIRRIMNDVVKLGDPLKDVIEKWNKDVYPMHKKYIEPWRHKADRVINGNYGGRKREMMITDLLQEIFLSVKS